VVTFSAFQDRCPIYRVVATRIKSLFEKPTNGEQSS